MQTKDVENKLGSDRKDSGFLVTLLSHKINIPYKSLNCPEKAYRYVVNCICNGTIKEGDRLVERDLAHKLHMSHIPIRETLNRLARDGWIMRIPNSGNYVKQFDSKSIKDIYLCREIVELGIIRKVAVSISDEQLHELKALVSIIDKANLENNLDEYRSADHFFHYKIVEFSDCQKLIDFYTTLMLQISVCCFDFWAMAQKTNFCNVRSLESNVTHSMIYASLEKHDPDWAYEVLKQHIATSCSINYAMAEAIKNKDMMK